uniref:Band 7 domain-containing protein n=1 Tax=Globodera rostochiensis TaxID=31243 RepID=A0A914GYP7_GLORO
MDPRRRQKADGGPFRLAGTPHGSVLIKQSRSVALFYRGHFPEGGTSATEESVVAQRPSAAHTAEGTLSSCSSSSSDSLSATSSSPSTSRRASTYRPSRTKEYAAEEEGEGEAAEETFPLMFYQQQQQEAAVGMLGPASAGSSAIPIIITGSALNTPRPSQSGGGGRPRMGRRFTLNPLIFAKEEREMRRQSLAQLKLSYYPKNADYDDTSSWVCQWMFWLLSWILLLLTFPVSVCFCIKIVKEYERAVIFRLGRLIGGGAKGPGIFWVMPCIESHVRVDLRTVSFSVPPQEILTRDSVTVSVDAVVFYRILNPTISVANVENAHHSTRLLAQTTMRNMLGTRTLSEILSDRDAIAMAMQTLLDEATDSWGIKVERVEIKDVRLPLQLQRAMAAEAEATREARAKVIAAEGEQRASNSLREAASMLESSPAALQLRFLQTLNTVAAEKNSTIS